MLPPVDDVPSPDPEAEPGIHKLKTALAILSQEVTERPPRNDPDPVRISNGYCSRLIPHHFPEEVVRILKLGLPSPELVFDERTIKRFGIILRSSQTSREHVEGVEGARDSSNLSSLGPAGPSASLLPQDPLRSSPAADKTQKQAQAEVEASQQLAKAVPGSPTIHRGHSATAPIHYRSSAPKFLARFLKTIYSRPELAARVQSLTFTLPHDSLLDSGIMKLLKFDADELIFPPFVPSDPSSSSSSDPDDTDPDDEAGKHPLEIAEEKFKLMIGIFVKPSNIPLRNILDMYVYLFSVCANVRRIEIPVEWEKEFRCGKAFPMVQDKDIRVVEPARPQE